MEQDTTATLDEIKKQMTNSDVESDHRESPLDKCGDNSSTATTSECNQPCNDSRDDLTLELFSMVFKAAQKPDKQTKNLQIGMAWVLTGALCVQVIWALILITKIINQNSSIAANALTFITLLVTAILAEVVAMAFVVVRFVFRTPLDTMIDLLKDIVEKKK